MASFDDGKMVYSNKKSLWSHAPTHSYGAWYMKGMKPQSNPSVHAGNLTGRTDTDYFYFLCPQCGQVLQWNIEELWTFPPSYEMVQPKGFVGQHLQISVRCRACKLSGIVKLSNNCLQGGKPNLGKPLPIEEIPTQGAAK